MGPIARLVATIAFAVACFAVAALGLAHRGIRAIEPDLPAVADIAGPANGTVDGPVRLFAVETASQAMPRRAVLAAQRDPAPGLPYEMSFPAFVLEWADGEIFLVDLGMERESAVAFGRPNEWVVGAEPIEFHRDVAAGLGAGLDRVSGVGFTHLHSDHTAGALALCGGTQSPIHVFYTPLQAVESNYTTRLGRAPVEQAACLEPRLVSGGPLYAVPGYAGLFVFAAGGHTPGSQVFVARMGGTARGRTFVFVGDLVNHRDGIAHDVPKPAWYSWLVVPEHTERLAMLRRFLAAVAEHPGVTLLVSHDRKHLESLGIELRR